MRTIRERLIDHYVFDVVLEEEMHTKPWSDLKHVVNCAECFTQLCYLVRKKWNANPYS